MGSVEEVAALRSQVEEMRASDAKMETDFASRLKRAKDYVATRDSLRIHPLKDTHKNDVPIIMAQFAATETRTLERRIAELEKDKERLDWLDLHGEGYGNGWICRLSEHGRGWRLHESSRDETFQTVRDAIDAAKGERDG